MKTSLLLCTGIATIYARSSHKGREPRPRSRPVRPTSDNYDYGYNDDKPTRPPFDDYDYDYNYNEDKPTHPPFDDYDYNYNDNKPTHPPFDDYDYDYNDNKPTHPPFDDYDYGYNYNDDKPTRPHDDHDYDDFDMDMIDFDFDQYNPHRPHRPHKPNRKPHVICHDKGFDKWCDSSWDQKRACVSARMTVASVVNNLSEKLKENEAPHVDLILEELISTQAMVLAINTTDAGTLYDGIRFDSKNLSASDPMLWKELQHNDGFVFAMEDTRYNGEGQSKDDLMYSCNIYWAEYSNNNEEDEDEDPDEDSVENSDEDADADEDEDAIVDNFENSGISNNFENSGISKNLKKLKRSMEKKGNKRSKPKHMKRLGGFFDHKEDDDNEEEEEHDNPTWGLDEFGFDEDFMSMIPFPGWLDRPRRQKHQVMIAVKIPIL